jgi:D-beta-D-heptose 7-phosphate kinase/D-beta-D-heptose 1-phosphate adenosyltransferase
LTGLNSKVLKNAVKKFQAANILVIGDIIVDHFIWGTVSRISPEAPVPVVNVTKENLLLGGAANVLHNIYDLGGKATLCGLIGDDAMGDHLLKLLADLSSPASGVVRSKNRPTTLKTRVIAQNQQVVRFDREKKCCPSPESLDEIFRFLDRTLTTFDAVIISDYDKGMISLQLMDYLRDRANGGKKIPLIVDPKPTRPERFKGVTIVTPNHHEAELMANVVIEDENDLLNAAKTLQKMLNGEAILITRGEAGMALFEKDKPLLTIPTMAKEVYDVTGAGDTVIATLALGLAVGLGFAEAATIANLAAGIVVGKIGTATASTDELLQAIQ